MPCVVKGLRLDKVIKTKIWKVARILNFVFIRKFKKAISCFQIDFFFYFLCFFCVHFFSFALLTIIRTTKQQRTYINKASNINKVITMTLWQNQGMTPYWIFRKKKLIWSYLGPTISICNIQNNFTFICVHLFSQNSNFSVVLLNYLIQCNYQLPKTNRSCTCIFSIGLGLLSSNILKKFFVLRTWSSPSFKWIVSHSHVHEKPMTISYIRNNKWLAMMILV